MVIQYEAAIKIDICKEFLRKQEKYLRYNVKKKVQRDTKLHSEFQLYKINEHACVCIQSLEQRMRRELHETDDTCLYQNGGTRSDRLQSIYLFIFSAFYNCSTVNIYYFYIQKMQSKCQIAYKRQV